MRVPLVDLKPQHRDIAEEVSAGFARVIDDMSLILGEDVARFERAFADFSGTAHCVGVANGTDALELMLRAIGVGPGDEVIVQANTFIATALGAVRAGATPVFVDCDARYHLMDPALVRAKLSQRTKAILPVHLYGQCGPMEELAAIANERGIALVEDAAQAQGARRNGRGIGAWGAAAATSFYPGKNLGAYGDAGGVVTNSPQIDAKLRALRTYGSERKYHHPEIGFNSRLDTLQAVVLNAKLKHLARWNEERRAAASRYDRMLSGLAQVTRPQTLPGNDHVWHLYVVRVPRRDEVLAAMNAAGVGAGLHYPVPLHLEGAFRNLGYKRGDFPVAERLAAEILTLPLFPGITETQQAIVVEELGRALTR